MADSGKPRRRRRTRASGGTKGSGKGKGKRRKKLTKKQRRLLKREQEREQRMRLIDDYARLERERLEEEERQQQTRDMMRKKAIEEEIKRQDEAAEVLVWLGERKVEIELLNAKAREADLWERHVACDSRPDPHIEREINAYISLWDQRTEDDLDAAFAMIQEAETVVADVETVLASAFEAGDEAMVARLNNDIQRIHALADAKLDAITSHLLQHADQFTDTERMECLIEVAQPDICFGMWVNVARNLRVKTRDFPALGVSTTISRGLALASVALRFCHTRWDSITPTSVSDEYATLGGVLYFDLLQLPTPPKQLKQWTMRPVPDDAQAVRRLGYPIVPPGTSPENVPVAPSPTWSLLTISYELPEDTLIRTRSPLVGWWDTSSRMWRTDGIENIRYDPKTRVVTFDTVHCAPVAVLQHRYIDLPFEDWMLSPTGANRAVLALTGGDMQVVIEVGEGYCRLTKPLDDCFKELRNNRLSPYLFMMKLSKIGVNMIPTNASVPRLSGVRVKDPLLEESLHAELALLAPAFAIGFSRWNAGRSAKKAVIKVRQLLDRSHQANTDDALTILYDRRHRDAVILKANDHTEDFTEEKMEGTALHRNVYSAVKEVSAPEGVMLCRAASDRFTESVRVLLSIVRPLSFVSE